MNKLNTEYMEPSKCIEILNISYVNFFRLLKHGFIPGVIKIGRLFRINRKDFTKFLITGGNQ